jgi:hypothetical protein
VDTQNQAACFVAMLIAGAIGCSGSARQKVVQRDDRSAATATIEHSQSDIQQSVEPQKAPSVAGDDALKNESRAPLSEPQPAVNAASDRITALKPPTIRPAVMPEVVLTEAHASDCMVRVGDEFPEFRLPDLGGRARDYDELRGELLTVVAFWSSDRALAASLLAFLDERIAAYADLGVSVVAVNVGDEPALVQELIQETIAAGENLLDPQRRLFSRVGRGHLPRVYLLDRDGRVLWFDIEFSRHTREQLEQAIQASLKST